MKTLLMMSAAEAETLAKRLRVDPGALPRLIEDAAYRMGVSLELTSDTPPHRTQALRLLEALEVCIVDG